MNKSKKFTTLFFDIGGVLLPNGWVYELADLGCTIKQEKIEYA